MLPNRKIALEIILPHLEALGWLVVLCLLQIQWPKFLTWGDIKPNILLIFLFYRVQDHTPLYGAFGGLVTGILLDVFSSGYLGFLALTYSLLGTLIGWLKQWFYLGKLKIQIGALFLVIIAYETIFLGLYRFLYTLESWYLGLYRVILPEALYTLVGGAFFLGLISRIHPSFNILEDKNRFRVIKS